MEKNREALERASQEIGEALASALGPMLAQVFPWSTFLPDLRQTLAKVWEEGVQSVAAEQQVAASQATDNMVRALFVGMALGSKSAADGQLAQDLLKK